MRKFYAIEMVAVLLCISMFTGCATIVNQTMQNVGIKSTPTGATVYVDGKPYGKTPVVAKLKRKDSHSVRIEMSGYNPYNVTLEKKVSGWFYGNILIGGLIGLVIDASTGAMYKLTPDQIDTELQKGGYSQLLHEDHLYLAFVLTPDPAWEKVGHLELTKNTTL